MIWKGYTPKGVYKRLPAATRRPTTRKTPGRVKPHPRGETAECCLNLLW